jgi:hypothetical protein
VYYLDSDKSGIRNAYSVGEYLEDLGIKVTIATPPEGKKDVNENGSTHNFSFMGFFEWALSTIEKLKPYTKELTFRRKMLNLPWQNASIKLLSKYKYLSKVIDKNIILHKYRKLATHSLTGSQEFTTREKLAFKEDNNFLFYLAHELDYIVDDEIAKISYFNNKRTLTSEEEHILGWLFKMCVG